MPQNLVQAVIYALVGITADGTIVPIQHDPDVGHYSLPVASLKNAEAEGYVSMPKTSSTDRFFIKTVEEFKPNESYFPGVVRLEVREYRFV